MGGAEAILNIRVALADNGQLADALEIRRRVYCSIGKLDPACLQDEFDVRATHFLGSTNGQWVSSARMVADGDFEMERYFDLSKYRRAGRCAEINRFAILPDFRGSAVAYAMFRGFYRYAIVNQIRFFCIAATPGRYCRMYLHLGFTQIGKTVMYQELREFHDAYVLDLDEALNDWRTKRPRILEYFLQPINGIG